MKMLCKFVFMSGVAMAAAAFPAMAQQGQQQMPMGQGGMQMPMGPSGTGMMNQAPTGQGMMGGYPMMMGGYPMMGGMMGPGMMMGSGMMGGGVQATNLNLSANDVTSYLGRWVTMTGNPHIKVGSVTEKDANTITADIVTTDKDALVQRFNVDRHTGVYTSVQ